MGTAYSALRIAQACERSKRRVLFLLANTSPDTVVITRSQLTPALTYEKLPAELLVLLSQAATRRNLDDARAVLDESHLKVRFKRNLSELSKEQLKQAVSYRTILSPFFEKDVKPGDAWKEAETRYKKEYGRSLHRRSFQRLLKEVKKRDGGLEDFTNLSLYVTDASRRQKKAAASDSLLSCHLESFFLANADLVKKTQLTIWDRESAYRIIFEFVAEHESILRGRQKSELIAALWEWCPTLASSQDALRRKLKRESNRKLIRPWESSRDRRQDNPGRPGPERFPQDLAILENRSMQLFGRIEEAFRSLHKENAFSPEFAKEYPYNPRSRNRKVPDAIRASITPRVRTAVAYHRDSRNLRLRRPSIRRDWSSVDAGDWFQSDDETANVYVWCAEMNGKYEYDGMRFDVLRPQQLPVVDCRTDNPLHLLVLGRSTYDSWAVRSLITACCTNPRVGLPQKGFYFERGVWKARGVKALVEWPLIDSAFARHGISLELRHATTPRAKIIERIFSREQNWADGLPGFAGRSERSGEFQSLQRFLRSLKQTSEPRKRATDPRKALLSLAEYTDVLAGIFRDFATDPQPYSRRLAGASPEEAWQSMTSAEPRKVLPPTLQYLLTTQSREVTVSHEGIRLKIGSIDRWYCGSSRLGGLVGEKLVVRFNNDVPERVIATHPRNDPKAVDPFIIESSPYLPAMTATKDDLKKAGRQRNLLYNSGRAIHREILRHGHLIPILQPNIVPDLDDIGKAQADTEDAHRMRGAKERAAKRTVEEIVRKAGLDPGSVKDPIVAIEALQGFEQLCEQINRRETQP